MSDDRNFQATSAPYSADNLRVHDKDLVFAKEFGTQTTSDAGDAFTTDSVNLDNNTNSINARMGMLESLNADNNAPESPRGTTFEVPGPDAYPTSPIAFDPNLRIYTMFAHLLLPQTTFSDPDSSVGYLILAGDGFVGNVPNAPFMAVGIRPEGSPNEGEEAEALVLEYNNGGDGNNPTSQEESEHWGTNLYIRLGLIQDVTKQSVDAEIDLSRDGITWTRQDGRFGDFQVTRVGIATSGTTAVWLDWVRTYSHVITSVGQALVPPQPLTGGRRFY